LGYGSALSFTPNILIFNSIPLGFDGTASIEALEHQQFEY